MSKPKKSSPEQAAIEQYESLTVGMTPDQIEDFAADYMKDVYVNEHND